MNRVIPRLPRRSPAVVFSLVALMSVLGSVAFTLGPMESDRSDVAVISAIVEGWSFDCEWHCSYAPCPPEHHMVFRVPDGESGDYDSSHNEQCTDEGSCADHACGFGWEEQQELLQDLAALEVRLGDLAGEDLRALAETNPAISVHAGRRAIQVTGCPNVVLLNLPLTPGQIRGFDAAG